MKRKALFIINPVSGGKSKEAVPGLINKHLDSAVYDSSVIYSSGVAHAHELAKEAAGLYDVVVAVGGDGTVNETASGIAGSETVLGVVPYGSGNGLSRFLSIPMDTEQAIENINNWRIEAIDAAQADGEWFFNMAGVGFDAHIASVFAEQKGRGFINYIKSTIKEVTSYKAQTYQLEIDGRHYEREAFIISFANSSQYGNNAHVAPGASVQDGLLDVCIIKPFPLWRFAGLAVRMFNKTAHKSKYVEIIKGKEIRIKRENPGPFHLDGEPRTTGREISISIKPAALKILAGRNFK